MRSSTGSTKASAASSPVRHRQIELHGALDAIAVTERDYGGMVGELLPALAASYGGPRQDVDRLADTLETSA